MKPLFMRTPMDASNSAGGYTLVELLIAMAVTAILGGAMVINYVSQERASTTVREVAQMQQQLRGAMFIMVQDLRIAGYNPQNTPNLFGVQDVRRYGITNDTTAPAPNAIGSPSVTIAYDWDPGAVNPAFNGDGILNEPRISYRLFDDNNDGVFDLVRDVGVPPALPRTQVLAENIEAIGFAYAFDADGDDLLDRNGANVIWAVDSDNDNRLDTNLDANNDGVIDLSDDTDGDYRITPADGAGLAAPVTWDRIRMVRVWMLARARGATTNYSNQGLFVQVGDQIVPNTAGGFNDNIRRRLLVKTVDCRNLGL